MSRAAVFMDRDGTIIDDTGFIRRVEDVKLLPNAAEAIGRLNAAGWLVVVVTNQSGVARGLLTEQDVAATNRRMQELLQLEGAHVDAIYYCPHLAEGKVPQYAVVCECRKPRPGMFLKAAAEHDIDLSRSVTIGDAPRDVEAGLDAGTRAILLTESATRADQAPDACGSAPDLVSAVTEILEHPPAAPVEEPDRRAVGEDVPSVRARPGAGKGRSAEEKKRRPRGKTAARKSEEEKAVADEEQPIPVHRAPKEFVPEQEVPETEEEPSVPAAGPAAGPPQAPAAATPAAGVRCGRCGGTIPPSDVETGKAFDKDGISLCRECIAALQAQRGRTRDVVDDELLRELKNITRVLTYERFSYWHVFGAITQAMALGCVIISHFMNAAPEGLLLAIYLQLLALTLFLLGRQ